MEHLPADAVLLIIDVQQGFDQPSWGQRNNLDAETQIATLLHAWRRTQRPIIHVQHLSTSPSSPLRPDQPGCDIKPIVQPLAHEMVIQKHVNSAFIGTNLEPYLREQGYHTLVITGLTTPHCVSTTTRMAGNLGFQTFLVDDATAAFEIVAADGTVYSAEDVHKLSLATLHNEFATVVSTQTLMTALEQD